MRLIRLAKAAAEAQGLYLKRTARGYAMQAGYGVGAAIFALMLLIMLHITAFAALVPGQGPVWAALIVAFVDLVLLVILGLMARSPPKDAIANEALRIRKEAQEEMKESVARAMVLAPLVRSQTAKKGVIGAALTAAVVGLLNRR